MYDAYSLCETAQALVAERLAEAERRRETHRAHIRTRAEARLHRAVTVARRAGLDDDTVARELADLTSDRTRNLEC